MISIDELVKFRSQLNTNSIEEETAAIIGYIYGKEISDYENSKPKINQDYYRSGYIDGWTDGISHISAKYANDVTSRKMLDSMLTDHIKPIKPVEPDVTIPKQ